jgi:hypothetical protein
MHIYLHAHTYDTYMHTCVYIRMHTYMHTMSCRYSTHTTHTLAMPRSCSNYTLTLITNNSIAYIIKLSLAGILNWWHSRRTGTCWSSPSCWQLTSDQSCVRYRVDRRICVNSWFVAILLTPPVGVNRHCDFLIERRLYYYLRLRIKVKIQPAILVRESSTQLIG